jgi:Flp pilus assembly protein TadD
MSAGRSNHRLSMMGPAVIALVLGAATTRGYGQQTGMAPRPARLNAPSTPSQRGPFAPLVERFSPHSRQMHPSLPTPFANPFVQRKAPPSDIQPSGTARFQAVAPYASADGLVQSARRYEQQGDNDGAVAQYHRALQQDHRNRRALMEFARMKHRLGDLDGAMIMYRQSLKYHPNDPVALNDLGLCQARKGNLRDAIESVSAAVQLRPESKRYRNNLAKLLIEEGQMHEALATLTEAHGEAIANYNLGVMLHQRGRKVEAIEYLAQASELDPSLTPARQLLAQLMEPSDHLARLPAEQDSARSESERPSLRLNEAAPSAPRLTLPAN